MKVKFPRVSAFLFFLFVLSDCKARKNIDDLKSLSEQDVQAILENAKDKYDKNVRKVFVFIEAEQELTHGGESFIREYRELFQNNLGTNYAVYILSDGSSVRTVTRNDDWLSVYEQALENQIQPKDFQGKATLAYARRFVNKQNLKDLTDRIKTDYGLKTDRANLRAQETTKANKANGSEQPDKAKKVQLILHFLAHGISANGANGFVGINNDNQEISWQEISDSIITPLTGVSDETIVILEPCYSGVTIAKLPNQYFYHNDAMVVVGAPIWSSQWAPSSDGPQTDNSGFHGELSKYFRSSVATMAIRAALEGYASVGYGIEKRETGPRIDTTPDSTSPSTNFSNTNGGKTDSGSHQETEEIEPQARKTFKLGDEQSTKANFTKASDHQLEFRENAEQPVRLNDRDLEVFEGALQVKEKHVVRVDEFVNYVEKKGRLINCNFFVAMRFKAVSNLCESPNLAKSDLTVGVGFLNTDEAVRQDLPRLLQDKSADARYKFIKAVNYDLYPVPDILVQTPHNTKSYTHALSPNPDPNVQGGNAILSTVNLNIFEASGGMNDQRSRFFALDRYGADRALKESWQICMDNLDTHTGALYDVLKAIYKNRESINEYERNHPNPGANSVNYDGESTDSNNGDPEPPPSTSRDDLVAGSSESRNRSSQSNAIRGWYGGNKPPICEYYKNFEAKTIIMGAGSQKQGKK